MNPGLKSVVIRVYYSGREISEVFPTLKYTFDEEGDDICELTVREATREAPDLPQFQEGAELSVTWGYIGGKMAPIRKVYISEVKWSFDKELITGTIQASEKGVSLKQTSSNKIHKGKNLPQLVTETAEKHGLVPVVEIPTDGEIKVNLTLNPNETLSSFLARENAEKTKLQEKKKPGTTQVNLKKILDQRTNDPYLRGVDSIKRKVYADYNNGATIDPEKTFMVQARFYDFLNNFKNNPNLPQANKTDKQFLVEQGKRQANGPYFIETRDDKIILKKRSFNQAPIKTYVYGGTDGDVLGFTPESKNKSKSRSSTSTGFSGWDPLTKKTFRGTTTPANLSPTLSKFVEAAKYYKAQQKRGLGRAVVGFRKNILTPFIQAPNISGRGDNTLVHKEVLTQMPVTVDDTVNALTKALNDASAKEKEKYKEVYNALGISTEDAYNNAENDRSSNELKKNPATLTVEGEPTFEVGFILTINGVSNKYSGNYYVTKTIHNVSSGSEYLTELEMHRQGHNIKVNENYLDSKTLGRVFNSEQGPKETTPKTKNLGVTSNRR